LTRRGNDLLDGLSLLLHYTMKGVQSRLHSSAVLVLQTLLAFLRNPSLEGASHHVVVVEGALKYLCQSVRPAYVGPLFHELLAAIQPAAASTNNSNSNSTSKGTATMDGVVLERYLTLLSVPLNHM